MTAHELTAAEDRLFARLAADPMFRGRLYRDGVPTPENYLAQRVKVLFVLREPNMAGKAFDCDMRVEVRDPEFRATRNGVRMDWSSRFWTEKMSLFAHAVAAALAGEPLARAWTQFQRARSHHEVVNRFAYIQIKKVGGSSTSNVEEICQHAARYASVLRQQIALYRPDLVLGCGTNRHAPATLLAAHVLKNGRAHTASKSTWWWEFAAPAQPRALVRLWHPSRRGISRPHLYRDVFQDVRGVLRRVELDK